MRFFASWWERVPVRAATPALVAVMFGFGLAGHAQRLFSNILGSYWQ